MTIREHFPPLFDSVRRMFRQKKNMTYVLYGELLHGSGPIHL